MSTLDHQTPQQDTTEVSNENAENTLAATDTTKQSMKQQALSTLNALPISPTMTGVLVGAVAGRILPVFGTFSGALLGGIAGNWYQRKCKSTHSSYSH